MSSFAYRIFRLKMIAIGVYIDGTQVFMLVVDEATFVDFRKLAIWSVAKPTKLCEEFWLIVYGVVKRGRYIVGTRQT